MKPTLATANFNVDDIQTLSMMEITDAEFNRIREVIYSSFGIRLTDEKRSLVVGRLQKYIKSKGFQSFSEYLHFLDINPSPANLSELVNRISTNHTFFFREKEHFEFFTETALPEVTDRLRKTNSRDLRVWCAGCSTGEEAYGLHLLMMEYFGREYGLWDAGLLATDISEKVLAVAREGVYGEDRMEQMPGAYKTKYFERRPDGQWVANERLKKELTFRRFNLMNEQFPFKKPFHVIFCRNVMIYFDVPTRDALAKRFYDCTAPGGYLFIGHSESLGRDRTPFQYVRPAVYRRLP